MEEKYYSLEEVANELKVAYLTVYRWVQAGKLQAHQIEKQYRVTKVDLDSFIENRRLRTTSELQEFSKEELIKIIRQLKKRKKFGLVWEEKQEDVVEQCKKELPVLEEVKGKMIGKAPDALTNLIIEGDNYHSLSVLNYTHAGRIDVIYIDPPYNTGKAKEWKFNDRWVDENDTYRHSKWLSFIEKRLKLAASLLSDRGVIFISIDDHEYHNLKLLCDEIFTERGFVGSLIWEKKKKGSHLDSEITNIKEYVLIYKKGSDFKGLVGQITEERETYPCINPGNGYSIRTIPRGTKSNYSERNVSLESGHIISSGNMKLTLVDDLVIEDNKLVKDVRIEAEWRYQQSSLDRFATEGTLYFTRDLYLRNIVTTPRYKKLKDILPRVSNSELADQFDELIELCNADKFNEINVKQLVNEIMQTTSSTKTNLNNLLADGWGSNEDADNEQRDFFGKKVFDYPKPTKLIKKILASTRFKEGVVLDFFAGSGTTAQAVIELNHETDSKLQFILCTNNEDNNGSGLKIAEDICFVRIKKVAGGYKKRNGIFIKGLPANLRYFKTSFVSKSKVSDDTRRELVGRSTEMICVRENTFEKLTDKKNYKIYKDTDHTTGILFNLDAIDDFKKQLHKQKLPAHIYVFSLSNDTYDEDFENLGLEHKLCPIPESILEVYRKLFRSKLWQH